MTRVLAVLALVAGLLLPTGAVAQEPSAGSVPFPWPIPSGAPIPWWWPLYEQTIFGSQPATTAYAVPTDYTVIPAPVSAIKDVEGILKADGWKHIDKKTRGFVPYWKKGGVGRVSIDELAGGANLVFTADATSWDEAYAALTLLVGVVMAGSPQLAAIDAWIAALDEPDPAGGTQLGDGESGFSVRVPPVGPMSLRLLP